MSFLSYPQVYIYFNIFGAFQHTVVLTFVFGGQTALSLSTGDPLKLLPVLFCWLLLFFCQTHLRHMKVPRELGIQCELQLKPMPPLWQCQIL